MKRIRQWQRILILVLLSLTVFAPIVLVSNRLKIVNSNGRKEFIEDLASIKYRADVLRLNAIEQELGEDVKEPKQEVYRDQNFSIVGYGTNDILKTGESKIGADHDRIDEESKQIQSQEEHKRLVREDQSNQSTNDHDQSVHIPHETVAQNNRKLRSGTHRSADEKVKLIRDHLIMAKAYLSFATSVGNTHLIKELRLRIKELERASDGASKDSDLSRSGLQKMRHMETTLTKASRLCPDCAAMVKKLRAMTYNAEEQVRAQRSQTTFLTELSGRTTPKGLHCLSMRLTADYFTLQSQDKELPNQQNALDPDLFHYVVFSDNVLACSVVVNSTVSNAMEPEKIVFHIVTDSLNFPAFSMWFLLNPPGKATILIRNMDNFKCFSKHTSTLATLNSHDPRFSSSLNHLRFYLPEIFPHLNKVVFLDHDVVVQGDLRRLWTLDMKARVNGAVETCKKGDSSYRRMDMFIDFSNPSVADEFNVNACTWAFGVNLFDLREWRRQDLTKNYHRFLQMGFTKPLWSSGTLPLGWLTFYNQTLALDRQWQVLGLGYEPGLKLADIERAIVIHYDGILKPWLDIGITRYKRYWNKYINFDHPYLQQCNIHE